MSSQNFTILVAEDTSGVRKLLVKVLTNLKFNNIVEAESGDEAWDILQKQPIDLLFSDIAMPNLTGLQLLEKIRGSNSDEIRNVPVIIVTNYGDKENVMKAIHHNANGYIVKPFQSKLIGEKVEEIFGEGFLEKLQSESS